MLAPWIVAAGRALLAIVLGLLITFTVGHTAAFGLVTFGVYAVLGGILLLAGSIGPRSAPEGRTAFGVQGAVGVVAGVAALLQPGGGSGYLIWVLSGWAIIAGALELVTGLRARRAGTAAWRDWVAVGALTAVLGAVVLLVPADLEQPFSGVEGVEGLLTSGIVVTGVLGAWAIITGVLQAIGAASPRLGAARTRTAQAPTEQTP